MSRAVITGIGLRTPLGHSPVTFFRNLAAGVSAISEIRKLNASVFPARIGAEIPADTMPDGQESADPIAMPAASRWAVAAARDALQDANIVVSDRNRSEVGIVLGVGAPALDAVESQALAVARHGTEAASLATPILMNPSNPAVQIGVALGLEGELITICTACASSSNALGYALRLIRSGEADCVIAGGVDEGLNPTFLASFGKGVLSRRNAEPARASRPFDRARDGYVLSDAAAIFVLESYEHASRRGARCYAELTGFGCSSEATSPMRVGKAVEPGAQAVEKALRMAGRAPDAIDYYCAHGSSSQWTDVRETRMVKRVFREHSNRLPVSSIKSMMGHPLGASGAVQLAASTMAIQAGVVPPTINYEDPDPECDLDYVPNEARPSRVRNAVIYALGNGGVNTALVVSDC